MQTAKLWSTIMAGHNWLDAIGRLAFPIFAFQTQQGLTTRLSICLLCFLPHPHGNPCHMDAAVIKCK